MHNIVEKKSGHAKARDLRWVRMLIKLLKILKNFIIMIMKSTYVW